MICTGLSELTAQKSVSALLAERYGLVCQPGKKTTCPFCNKTTLSVKLDDTLAKCFHPSCGRFITAHGNGTGPDRSIQRVLESIYQDWHEALLAEERSSTYRYLVDERKTHPQVVAESMLGAVPPDYDLYSMFSPLFDEESEDNADHKKPSAREAYNKLQRCISGASGWLCFFYTDAHHNIVAIRFRKPFSKKTRYFKPFKNSGLFGREIFSTKRNNDITLDLMVTEGEFNQLQLQSLAVRHSESTGKDASYVNACAVGGVNNADIECLKAVSKEPTICYDNDKGKAGLALVDKACEHIGVNAFTTPGEDSDLDSYIRSFEGDHEAAWNGIKELIADRKQYARHYGGVAKEVYSTRQKKGKLDMRKEFEINTEVTDKIRADLQGRGKFYYDPNGAYFFHQADKSLISLDRENPDCALLFHNYGINRTETIYRYIVEELRMTAHKQGQETEIHRLAHYEKDSQIVHLTNFDNQIYQISADDIKLVDNGTDGVLFLSDPDAEPFAIHSKNTDDALFDRIILDKINFAKDVLSPEERRLLLAFWVLSVFFKSIMPSKPILAFVGEKGSGKSITARRLGMMIFGSKFDVMPLPHKVEDFDAAITNSEFVAIDNADSRSKWLEDRLATVATGGTLERRQLYTTNTRIKTPIRCFVSITSRTPYFKRDDVADRILLMKVDRFDVFKPPEVLLKEVIDHRDALMTDMAGLIQDALKALQTEELSDDSTTVRMADFGVFALKLARHWGIEKEVQNILDKLTQEQSAFTLEGDLFYDLLTDWAEENGSKEVTSSELCGELAMLAETRGVDFYFKGKERAFAQKLTRLKPNLEQFFDITEREAGSRKKLFSFRILAQEGVK